MMGEERVKSSSCAFAGQVVVSGGETALGGSKNSVEAYDHCSDRWSPMPEMVDARKGHSSAGIRNKLYVVGGSYTMRCEVYDGFSGVFARISSEFPVKQQHYFNTPLVVFGNKIVVFNKLQKTAVYDLDEEKWVEQKGISYRKGGFQNNFLKFPMH